MKMKRIVSSTAIRIFFSLIPLFTFIDVFAQGAQRPITNISVSPELVGTADIKSSNVETYVAVGKWIQIKIDFSTALKNTPMGKNYFEYLDNVRVETEVLLPTGHPQRQYVLLMGRADYWAIALDGKEHHMVMFVPPQIIARWAPGEKLNNSDVKKIEIKVIFKQNDAIIGVGYHVPRGKTDVEVAKRFQAVLGLPDLERVRNGVYSIDKTPWAHLNFDYYELIKTSRSSEE